MKMVFTENHINILRLFGSLLRAKHSNLHYYLDDSPIPDYPDNCSLDNYKFFKDQHGETITRYVGLNNRNDPPKKAILGAKEKC